MILFDCGNTQIKAQHYSSASLRSSFACSYQLDWKARLSRWLQAQDGKQAFQCSVLDLLGQADLDACLAAHFGNAVTRFGSEAQACGVINGYHQPERLGADRWMALLAARAMTEGGCMIIDAGSAITVDLLRTDGQHLGGAILPGLNTDNDRFRRIFAHIDFEHPEIVDTALPGCSTEAAIQIDYDYASIDRLPALVNNWIPLLDQNPALILAGGDAARVQQLLEYPARIVPDLVFRGIRRLAER